MRAEKTILGVLITLGLSARVCALPQELGPVQIQNGAHFVQSHHQSPRAIKNWGQFHIRPDSCQATILPATGTGRYQNHGWLRTVGVTVRDASDS